MKVLSSFYCLCKDGRNLPIKLSSNSVCFNSKLTSDHNDLPFKSKWMGMVSRKVFPKAIPRISTRCSVVFICLLVFLLLNTVETKKHRCRVDHCNQKYRKKDQRLLAREDRYSEEEFQERQCRVLDKYQRCLLRIQGVCRGNLLFHSVLQINSNNLKNANCPKRSTEKSNPVSAADALSTTPDNSLYNSTSGHSVDGANSSMIDNECQFIKNPDYRHCGMFGDPHLRTFSDRLYTCSVVKAWKLIENDHITVMATNFPVEKDSEATVTTQITVLIKEHKNCAEQRMYVATSDQLPGAFVDGSSITGSVFVVEVEQDRHIEIHARYIATTIIIRRVARYLTFAIRLPNQLVSASSNQQLCVSGCPKNQIKRTSALAKSQADLAKSSKQDSRRRRSLDDDDGLTNDINFEADLLGSDIFAVKQHFSEEYARRLCKRILLDSQSEEIEQKSTEIAKEETDLEDKNKQLTSSESSRAFTSLVSSPNRDKRKRNKGKKHKSKRKKKSKPDRNRSSFRRLRGTQESNGDAVLPSDKPNNQHHRKGRKRTKHQITETSDSTSENSNETDQECSSEKDDPSSINFYFDSCVFDLTTTGDANFTFTAKAALEDVKQTHLRGLDAPGASLSPIRRWKPIKKSCRKNTSKSTSGKNPGNGSSRANLNAALLVFCLLLASAFINSSSIALESSRSSSKISSQISLSQRSCDKKTTMFFNAMSTT